MRIEAERMQEFCQKFDLLSSEDVTFYWKFYPQHSQGVMYNGFFAETLLDFNLKTLMLHDFLENTVSELPADESLFSAIKTPKGIPAIENIFNVLDLS
ncbi:MAG: hypothetical protein QXH03_05265 [Candidatus Bathyarchaeia archaeon]